MCCSDAPDSTGQVRQAEASERLGNRQLDLAEQQYADQSDLQREFLDLTRANSESDAELKDIQTELTLEQAQRRRDIFDPLEASLVYEAENFDSPDRMASEMGKADAAVVQAYDKASRGAARDSLRMGINPNSGKAMALKQNAALETAKAAASASTAAGERVKAKGFGMRMDAAGLGRNLVSNQTAAADSAVRAGQSSVQGFQAGVDQGNRNFDSVTRGFGSAGNAFSAAGNIYGNIAQQEAASSAADSQGIGSVVGIGLML
ncbi:MAG: hypothetical protein KF740_12250 [Ramlibacter sp.]|nr:hypothetical protein [Ramlibacter sp.]